MMRSPAVSTASSSSASQHVLRQAGAGVEQHLQPAEECLAQGGSAAQIRQQHLVALRHVEIDRRRDLAQIAHGLGDRRRAPACPRRYRASRRCTSTSPKLWLPPKVWFHGSQSTITGGSSPRKARPARIIAWLPHSMRWVLMTPFGWPVEPEVNRIFAIVSGPTGVRRFDRRRRLEPPAVRRSRRAAGRPAGLAATTTSTSARHGGGDGARECRAVGGEDQAGRQQLA